MSEENKEIQEVLIQVVRIDGKYIKNGFNFKAFTDHINKDDIGTFPDTYLAFILKTIIDDFGDFGVQASGGRVNKEHFEAALMDNLKELLSQKTKIY